MTGPRKDAMRVVDLFCGCGGMSLGFEMAGFDVVAGFDNWEEALVVYKANHDHEAILYDLSDVEGASELVRAYKPDVIVGGPPCQDFSTAGKMEEGDNAALTVCFAEIVAKVKPRFFVMENVPAIRRSKSYAKAMEIFASAGYGITPKVVDASRFGVPQRRRRMVVFGKIGGSGNEFDSILDSMLSPEQTTFRSYLGDKVPFEHYYRHPTTYKRRGIFSVDEPCPTVRGINRPIPKTYVKHKNDPVEPKGLRGLTLRERATIQSFPDSYVFEGKVPLLEKMIGNAVPVLLAEIFGMVLISEKSN